MKTLAHLSLVSVLALGSLPLAGCMGDASTHEPGGAAEADEPVGTAESADSTGITIYDGPFYEINSATFTADTADLGAWDNRAMSLKNNTGSVITLWSGKNFTGRCQPVFPYLALSDLDLQEIGPQRLSSIQLGDHCTSGTSTSTMTLSNQNLAIERLRTSQDNMTGFSWTSGITEGLTTSQTFPKNAWKVEADVQWLNWVQWDADCSHSWQVDDDLQTDHVIIVDDNGCHYY
jgi:hypothetical protein